MSTLTATQPSSRYAQDNLYTGRQTADQKFASYQAKNGKVTAVTTMQRDPIVAKASELMRLDIMPSLDEIRNGKVSYQIPNYSSCNADIAEHLGDRVGQGVKEFVGTNVPMHVAISFVFVLLA